MKFSAIIATCNRTDEVARVLRSLHSQTWQDFEIIISDQNKDDRLFSIIQGSELQDRLIHIKTTGGASRGRNEGMRRATGDILCFPDDDCVYPPTLFERIAAFFQENPQYGYISGRSIGDDGKDAVSRHSKKAAPIEKLTIHSQSIEFALFFRRAQLKGIYFDELMGPGAPSPWQSDEGPDLLLQLKDAGVQGYYEPQFAVWHPQPIKCFNAQAIDRTYRYACGNGYFLRKNKYPMWFLIYQMGRTLCGLGLGLFTFNRGRASLYLARLRGRWRGWTSNPGVNRSNHKLQTV